MLGVQRRAVVLGLPQEELVLPQVRVLAREPVRHTGVRSVVPQRHATHVRPRRLRSVDVLRRAGECRADELHDHAEGEVRHRRRLLLGDLLGQARGHRGPRRREAPLGRRVALLQRPAARGRRSAEVVGLHRQLRQRQVDEGQGDGRLLGERGPQAVPRRGAHQRHGVKPRRHELLPRRHRVVGAGDVVHALPQGLLLEGLGAELWLDAAAQDERRGRPRLRRRRPARHADDDDHQLFDPVAGPAQHRRDRD
mmetsp:Transcript_31076/g.88689  ORF Transcript_31076/g.88689 Transcript_31076/m.88689 type:complete len:252 (-) Transcript_31076:210-965(-)